MISASDQLTTSYAVRLSRERDQQYRGPIYTQWQAFGLDKLWYALARNVELLTFVQYSFTALVQRILNCGDIQFNGWLTPDKVLNVLISVRLNEIRYMGEQASVVMTSELLFSE